MLIRRPTRTLIASPTGRHPDRNYRELDATAPYFIDKTQGSYKRLGCEPWSDIGRLLSQRPIIQAKRGHTQCVLAKYARARKQVRTHALYAYTPMRQVGPPSCLT